MAVFQLQIPSWMALHLAVSLSMQGNTLRLATLELTMLGPDLLQTMEALPSIDQSRVKAKVNSTDSCNISHKSDTVKTSYSCL